MTGLNSSHGVKTADLRTGPGWDRRARRLSMILNEIANDDSRDRVSIGDLCDASAAALALLERDGMVMIIGGLVGLASLALATGILYGIVEAALFVLAATIGS